MNTIDQIAALTLMPSGVYKHRSLSENQWPGVLDPTGPLPPQTDPNAPLGTSENMGEMTAINKPWGETTLERIASTLGGIKGMFNQAQIPYTDMGVGDIIPGDSPEFIQSIADNPRIKGSGLQTRVNLGDSDLMGALDTMLLPADAIGLGALLRAPFKMAGEVGLKSGQKELDLMSKTVEDVMREVGGLRQTVRNEPEMSFKAAAEAVDPSRREFLKNAGLMTAGVAAGGKVGKGLMNMAQESAPTMASTTVKTAIKGQASTPMLRALAYFRAFPELMDAYRKGGFKNVQQTLKEANGTPDNPYADAFEYRWIDDPDFVDAVVDKEELLKHWNSNQGKDLRFKASPEQYKGNRDINYQEAIGVWDDINTMLDPATNYPKFTTEMDELLAATVDTGIHPKDILKEMLKLTSKETNPEKVKYIKKLIDDPDTFATALERSMYYGADGGIRINSRPLTGNY